MSHFTTALRYGVSETVVPATVSVTPTSTGDTPLAEIRSVPLYVPAASPEAFEPAGTVPPLLPDFVPGSVIHGCSAELLTTL